MRSGSVRRPTWEPRTVGTDGSGSRGAWATPSVANANGNSTRGAARGDEALLPGAASQWPTPKAVSGGANSMRDERGAGGLDLQETAGAWPTPSVGDHGMSGASESRPYANLEPVAKGWPTPACRDEKGANLSDTHATDQLANVAPCWPTPTSTDSLGSRNSTCPRAEDSKVAIGDTLTDAALTFPCSHPALARGLMTEAVGSSLSIETLPDGSRCLRKGPTSRRRLNPLFVERLMGWPEGWTAYAPVETASWWSKVRSHLASFSEGQG